ncbi:pro-sigmaK processing inhibitor BofA family protein [Treponema sp. R6D11]
MLWINVPPPTTMSTYVKGDANSLIYVSGSGKKRNHTTAISQAAWIIEKNTAKNEFASKVFGEPFFFIYMPAKTANMICESARATTTGGNPAKKKPRVVARATKRAAKGDMKIAIQIEVCEANVIVIAGGIMILNGEKGRIIPVADKSAMRVNLFVLGFIKLLLLAYSYLSSITRRDIPMNTILAYIFGGIVLYVVVYATYPIWRLFKRFFFRGITGLAIITGLQMTGFGLAGANLITGLFCALLGIPGVILLEVIAKII